MLWSCVCFWLCACVGVHSLPRGGSWNKVKKAREGKSNQAGLSRVVLCVWVCHHYHHNDSSRLNRFVFNHIHLSIVIAMWISPREHCVIIVIGIGIGFTHEITPPSISIPPFIWASMPSKWTKDKVISFKYQLSHDYWSLGRSSKHTHVYAYAQRSVICFVPTPTGPGSSRDLITMLWQLKLIFS